MKNYLPVFGRRAKYALCKHIKKNLFVFLSFFLCSIINLNAQVSGRVYKDFNANGSWDSTATHLDQGVAGLKVEVFDKNGVSKGSALTNTLGQYYIPNITGSLRIRFTVPAFYTDGFITSTNSHSQSNVQFINAPSTGVDLGLNTADDFCGEDPKIVVACYVVGIATTSSADAGLALFNYSASGTDHNQISMPNASLSYIGSTWGGAYQRESNSFFMAAFMKRHANFGVGGTGAIYVTKNVTANNSSTELYLDLNALGFNTGSNPHSIPDYQMDTINVNGNPFDDVGKISLGDMDISSDGKYLFVVNLKQRKLHKIFIDNPHKSAGTITAADITSWDIPSGFDELNKGIGRPFGLCVKQDKVYVGVTCDASISQDSLDLKARIYEIKPNDAVPTWKLEIEFPLNYKKGIATGERKESGKWYPWISDWWVPGQPDFLRGKPDPAQDKYIAYPMPLMSDIEIDADGSMIVAFTDRFGHQVRFAAVDAHGNHHGTFGFDPRLGGDIVRFGRCDGVNWTMENNGTVCGVSTNGKDNNQGYGGGEYYYGEGNPSLGLHELSVGSLCFKPGSREICLASNDPIREYSAGMTWLDNENGSKKRAFEIISELNNIIIGAPVQFGKASSFGDVNIVCAVSPLEIGNRLWRDDNGNGIQDAGEPGIANVLLHLVNATEQIVGKDTTDINGVYSFNHFNVIDTVGVSRPDRLGPQPNTNYKIKVKGKITATVPAARSQRVAAATAVSTPDTNDGGKLIDDSVLGNTNAGSGPDQDLLDSDGILTGNDGVIDVITLDAGQSNHSYDFAYCPLPKVDLVIEKATCDPITDTPLNNASVAFSNIQFTHKVGYSSGINYTGPLFANAKEVNSTTTFTIDSLPGSATDQIYTVRIFNASDDCARDIQITVPGTTCIPCKITGTANASSILVNNNGTPTDPADDYFTVQAQANATNAGAADLYEVVINANPNGTGGTVLNPGGTYYNQPVKVGLGKELKANSVAIKLTVRDAIKPACVNSVDVQADPFRLECKPDICLPIKIVRTDN